MLELVPRPVAPDVPLRALLAGASLTGALLAGAPLAGGLLAPTAALSPPFPVGVWFRSRRRLTILTQSGQCRRVLLLDPDLGALVRRCSSVVVQLGSAAVAVTSEELVRARALRVVVGRPYAAAFRALHAVFPDALGAPPAIEIPLSRRSAEEVLAACAAARGPVVLSRVVYRRVAVQLGEGPADRVADRVADGIAVDSPPGGPLG